MRVEIAIVKPDLEETTLSFDGPAEITIGRSPNCACCLDYDTMASRMHAVLLIEPPGIRVKDLNSTNGLVLNGETYGGYGGEKSHGPQELRDGDELLIGRTLFRIRVVDGEVDEVASVIDTRETYKSSPIGMETSGFSMETVSTLSSLVPEVPGYRIFSFLGSGRIGSVYKGCGIDGGESVAVKILFPDLPFSPKIRETFRSGLEELRTLDHPNLVKCHGGGSLEGGSVYMVTEYVNGEDLSAYLYKFPGHIVPLPLAMGIFRQVCSGLAYAHRRGVTHRDLKPQKILLANADGELTVKVSDVGLARVFEESGLPLHGAVADVESRAYTAPEQMLDPRNAQPAIDVFGAGAVMYEMLVGACPYQFSGAFPPSIVPMEERLTGLPEPLLVIVERCLLSEPEARYRNCEELLDAMENIAL